jgi:hypothetical protein
MIHASSLWRSSRPWRWVFSLTVLLTGLCVLAAPWQSAPPLVVAQYQSPQQVPATSGAVVLPTVPVGGGPKRPPQNDPVFDDFLANQASTYPPNAELHVIGVYGAAKPQGLDPWFLQCRQKSGDDMMRMRQCQIEYHAAHPELHTVAVDVQRSGPPIVLVLMAYESVIWKLSVASGVNIVKIIVAGYSGQDIQGAPADVPVEVRSHESSPCINCERQPGYFYGYEPSTREYTNALAQLRDITGLAPSSFQGSYQASRFSVARWLGGVQRLSAESTTESLLGVRYSNQLPLKEATVMLPDGVWETIAASHVDNAQGEEDIRVLKRMAGGVLAEVLAVHMQTNSTGSGFASYAACQRPADYLLASSVSGESCYWLSHLESPWKQPIYRVAAQRLREQEVSVPIEAVSAGFHQQGSRLALTTQYYAFPDNTSISSWERNPWNPAKLPGSERKQWLDQRLVWAKDWSQLFKVSLPKEM